MTRSSFLSLMFLVAVVRVSAAQAIPPVPNPDEARVRFGPVWLRPTFALSNIGWDTNVFNEADSDRPERDFTFTVTPQTEVSLRMGRTWILGVLREDLVWYSKFESERAVNPRSSVAWLVPLNRLSFLIGTDRISARERPGFEIDARSRRNELGVNGAADVRVLSKTTFGVRGSQRSVKFDQDATFFGNSLRFELNRTLTTRALTIRHSLTPLTRVTLEAGRDNDRFEFSTLRDSDSTRVKVGVEFDPFALIKGSAQIGYRNFKPLSPDVPNFAGTTSTVNLSYVAFGSTRVGISVTRDVNYSYDVGQPYYLQTGITGSLAQQIFGPVDAEVRAGTTRLAYRTRRGVIAPENRIDRVRSYGGGVGYRLGESLRLALNFDVQRRSSIVDLRNYNGARFGLGMTYGF